ncbi:8606_t:CDS:2 [Racocetra fulgida]|uniref:8606_t:CDS:1 n=1 Tax=Racocetra fulgida TaxID=60492 RepID=A0A9N9EI70_9GLOM|nr:8606_t:CDS:2 [Racocetra fulgida]
MTASTSTHLTIADKVSDSNKCPLKISLIGVSQGMPVEIKDTDNSVLETLISNYLLYIHQNVTKNLEDSFKESTHSLKCKRSEENIKTENVILTNATNNSIQTDKEPETDMTEKRSDEDNECPTRNTHNSKKINNSIVNSNE